MLSICLIDIYVLLDQIGDAEFKNEMKTWTGSSFPSHFGEKPNFRRYIYVRRRWDRPIDRSTSDTLDRHRGPESKLLHPGELTLITQRVHCTAKVLLNLVTSKPLPVTLQLSITGRLGWARWKISLSRCKTIWPHVPNLNLGMGWKGRKGEGGKWKGKERG